MNVMKLVKLMYLLDRASIENRDIPVVGGQYFSMRNGPVTSEVLDLINSGRLADDPDDSWEKHISDRDRHEVELISDPISGLLSEYEMELIKRIYEFHRTKNQWEIRDWCHQNCREWEPLKDGCEPILVEKMAICFSKSTREIETIRNNSKELNALMKAFSVR